MKLPATKTKKTAITNSSLPKSRSSSNSRAARTWTPRWRRRCLTFRAWPRARLAVNRHRLPLCTLSGPLAGQRRNHRVRAQRPAKHIPSTSATSCWGRWTLPAAATWGVTWRRCCRLRVSASLTCTPATCPAPGLSLLGRDAAGLRGKSGGKCPGSGRKHSPATWPGCRGSQPPSSPWRGFRRSAQVHTP